MLHMSTLKGLDQSNPTADLVVPAFSFITQQIKKATHSLSVPTFPGTWLSSPHGLHPSQRMVRCPGPSRLHDFILMRLLPHTTQLHTFPTIAMRQTAENLLPPAFRLEDLHKLFPKAFSPHRTCFFIHLPRNSTIKSLQTCSICKVSTRCSK